MKKLIFNLLCVFTCLLCNAQSVDFEKLYPAHVTAQYAITDFVAADDGYGGYIIAAGAFLFSAEDSTAVAVLHINAAGDTLWQKVFDTPGTDIIKGITRTADGNFLLAGSRFIQGPSISSISSSLIWLTKINPAGAVIWEKLIDPAWFYGWPSAVFELEDGTIMLAGNSYAYWMYYSFLAKFDADGNMKWMEFYDNFSDFSFCSVQKDDGDNFFIGGIRDNINTGFKQLGMVKTDKYGQQIFSKTYSTSTFFGIAINPVLSKSPDGGFFLTGSDIDDNQFAFVGVVLKIKANGSVQWKKYFHGPNGSDVVFQSSVATDDGGVMVLTESNSLVKYKANGDTAFTRDLRPLLPDSVQLYQIFRGADGKALLIGSMLNHHIFLLKLDAPALTPTNETIDNQANLQVFPNPTSGAFWITNEFPAQPLLLRLTDSQGRLVEERLEITISDPVYKWEFNAQNPAGVYWLQAVSAQGSRQVKIIKM